MFINKFVQLAFPAYLICVNMVLCHKELLPLKVTGEGIPLQYRLQQHGKCGGKFVQINGRNSFATTRDRNNTNTLLHFQYHEGGVTIMGVAQRLYMCFSKEKKKLITKNTWKNDTYCLFSETTTGGYYEYSLLNKTNWLIGFNRKGRPLRATAIAGKRKASAKNMRHVKKECVQFTPFGRPEVHESRKEGPTLSPQNLDIIIQDVRGRRNRKRRTPRPRMSVKTTSSESSRNAEIRNELNLSPLVRIRRDEPQLLRTLRLLSPSP